MGSEAHLREVTDEKCRLPKNGIQKVGGNMPALLLRAAITWFFCDNLANSWRLFHVTHPKIFLFKKSDRISSLTRFKHFHIKKSSNPSSWWPVVVVMVPKSGSSTVLTKPIRTTDLTLFGPNLTRYAAPTRMCSFIYSFNICFNMPISVTTFDVHHIKKYLEASMKNARFGVLEYSSVFDCPPTSQTGNSWLFQTLISTGTWLLYQRNAMHTNRWEKSKSLVNNSGVSRCAVSSYICFPRTTTT